MPSTTRPFFYGIVDARHACDERFWLQVLPAFFFSDARSQVTCVESISFVQLWFWVSLTLCLTLALKQESPPDADR